MGVGERLLAEPGKGWQRSMREMSFRENPDTTIPLAPQLNLPPDWVISGRNNCLWTFLPFYSHWGSAPSVVKQPLQLRGRWIGEGAWGRRKEAIGEGFGGTEAEEHQRARAQPGPPTGPTPWAQSLRIPEAEGTAEMTWLIPSPTWTDSAREEMGLAQVTQMRSW